MNWGTRSTRPAGRPSLCRSSRRAASQEAFPLRSVPFLPTDVLRCSVLCPVRVPCGPVLRRALQTRTRRGRDGRRRRGDQQTTLGRCPDSHQVLLAHPMRCLSSHVGRVPSSAGHGCVAKHQQDPYVGLATAAVKTLSQSFSRPDIGCGERRRRRRRCRLARRGCCHES